MIYVAQFERVSEKQFPNPKNVRLPERATAKSAGYDFFTPIDIDVKAGEYITVATGIRCKIDENWFLALVPKSGLGFKYGMRLANTLGVVDCDYYYSDNEGHIMVKFTSDKDFHLNAGDKFCQGIFMKYGVTFNDEANGIRNGGFGSTGK
jgi:dUTP pyrophosphatase